MATSSLGRLTLDLIARTGGFETGMDRAARHSQRRTREMQRQWQQVRSVIMAAGAALGVAFSARAFQNMIRSNAAAIDSLAKTADALNVPIERLQTLQYAAEQSGVASGTLTSGLQRMQRALGDAARSGTGANRAIEALGLNIQDLLNLSPDRQFEVISKALMGVENETVRASIANEIFGRSWADLSNLMRTVADDGLSTLQRELEQLGFILTREGAARVEMMNDSLNTLSKFSAGVSQQLTVALAPAIRAVTMSLIDAAKETGGFSAEMEAAADKVVRGMAFAADAVMGFVRVWQLAGRGVALVALNIELRMAQLTDSIFNGPVNAINTLISLMNRIPGLEVGAVGPISQRRQDNVAQIRRAIAEAQADIRGVAMMELPGAGILRNYEIAKREAEQAGREIGERLNRGMEFAIEGGDSGSLARSVARQVAEVDRELEALMRAGQRVFEETRTPAEALSMRIEYLNRLLEAGAIDWDTYARAIFAAQEAFDATREAAKAMAEDVQDGTQEMSQFAIQAARNMQSAFADFLFDPFDKSLKDMLRSFVLTIHRMVSELLAQQLLLSFFNAINPAAGLGTALFGGFRADGGPVAPGRAYVVGEKGPELFVPGTAGNIQPNGGAGVRIINVVDPSLVADYMSGPGGDQLVLNVLKRNAGSVRQIVA